MTTRELVIARLIEQLMAKKLAEALGLPAEAPVENRGMSAGENRRKVVLTGEGGGSGPVATILPRSSSGTIH